jgi:transcriptional regulator with XRE-family HTH domain
MRFMDTPAERLQAARIAAGYATVRDAANALGMKFPTYAQHESGLRGIPKDKALSYARIFKTTPEWILYGKSSTGEPTIQELEMMLHDALEEVVTVQTRLSDLPRIVAPNLFEQLARFRLDRANRRSGK